MIKDSIMFPDFQKLDLRVGKIISAEYIPQSQNLIRLKVDLGEDYGQRKIIAGIAKWFKPEQIKGKKYIFIANLAPKKMMKEESNGMMLACDRDSGCALIPVDNDLPAGTVVR